MTKAEMKQCVAWFKKAFGPPFLPEGFATAHVAYAQTKEPTTSITIGRRDAAITAKMDSGGSGTCLASRCRVIEAYEVAK